MFAMNSDWKSPNDVKQTYANESILKDSRIVFNIKWIFIRFIGTHAEYDKINADAI